MLTSSRLALAAIGAVILAGCGVTESAPTAPGARVDPPRFAPTEPPRGQAVALLHHTRSTAPLRVTGASTPAGGQVTIWREDGSFGLWSEVSGGVGTVTWDGWVFRADGAIQPAALQSLVELGQRPEATELILYALELACTGTGPADLATWAALLLPWQLLVKHVPDWVDPRPWLALAPCALHGDPDAHALPFRTAPEDPLPWVPGFELLDAVGATPAPSPDATLQGPCGARCRGACGPDCDPDACDTSVALECLTDGYGAPSGERQTLFRYTCGSHEGCRDHDACYDDCNAGWGCGGVSSWVCRRGCDAACLATYCPGGQLGCECSSWMVGWGPFDAALVFEELSGAPVLDAACGGPPADSCAARCGAEAPTGCWCDDLCPGYGDCCPDACGRCGHCP